MAAAGALSIGLGATAWGQDSPTARTLFLTFDQSLRATDNQALRDPSAGVTTRAATRLGLQGEIRDPLNQLRFSTSAGLDAVKAPGRSFETDSDLSEPRLNFTYSRSGATSSINTALSYRRDDVRFTRPLEDFFDEEGELELPADTFDLNGTGTRAQTVARISAALFRDAPLGLDLSAATNRRNYENVSDPGLFDTKTDTVSVGLRARINPVTTARLTLSQSAYDAEDAARTQRDRTSLTLGLERDVNEVLSFSASIGRTEVETVQNGVIRNTDTATGSFGVSLDRPLGALTANAAVTNDGQGQRITVRAGRSIALEAASLSFSLGATWREGNVDGLETVAQLAYRQELPTGGLSVTLNRQVSDIDDDQQQRLVTSLRAGYSHTINPVSSFNLSGAYVTRDDSDRFNFNAGYSRTLTEDWSLNAGYRYTTISDPGRDADSHSIFANIGRRFDLPF